MSFGIANNVRSEVRVCTPDLLREALDSPLVAQTCSEIKDALEARQRGELTPDEYETLKNKLKKQLPVFTFHAAFKGGRRKNTEAMPSGLSMYDLDHIPNPQAKWTEVQTRIDELGIVFAHVTPSTEGLRLVFVIPQGMTLAEAQAWMAQQLGDDKYDACVKDYARSSFAVPRDYVLYLSERLFNEELFNEELRMKNEEFRNEELRMKNEEFRNEELRMKNEEFRNEEIPASCSRENNSSCCREATILHSSLEDAPSFPQSYEDIPYAQIVETLEEQMGGRPEHGSRNNFIFSMACHLRHVCNDDALWIARILPTYGEARDKWMATIRSACARNQTKQMPRIMRRTLAICKSQDDTPTADADTPPAMPRKLPPLIRLLVSRTPKIYRPAVAHAVFPSLAAHLWRTTFRYIDNVDHEATMMNVLMAGTGAGKNCIAEPINRIMKDIRRRDADNLMREKEWKKEMQTKGANKDKRQRPEGLVIQEIDPDMTNAAFVQRLADAEERFLYAKMNEIDQFDALKTSARSKAHFQIMCLAFDPQNVYGQTRIGTGSVSERVSIRFNWNASTTIQKGKAYFRSVLTDGPISRINFCTIPERPIGSPMPVYGTYDASFDEELRPYIDRLNKARGLIECRPAKMLAKRLMEENADFARLSESRVYENLSFRANVIAYLKACILYVAQGCEWDKSIEEFVRWSLRYDMWCKMRFFGEAIEEVDRGDIVPKRSGPRNLLELLPDTFTREEAQQMRQRQGIRRGSLSAMLNNWKSRGYIRPCDEQPADDIAQSKYAKTEEYLKRHPKENNQSVNQFF